MRAVVDIAAVAHVDDCIAVVVVKVEGRIAAVGALGDCIVVAYSLIGKAHHSKYGTQVAEHFFMSYEWEAVEEGRGWRA